MIAVASRSRSDYYGVTTTSVEVRSMWCRKLAARPWAAAAWLLVSGLLTRPVAGQVTDTGPGGALPVAVADRVWVKPDSDSVGTVERSHTLTPEHPAAAPEAVGDTPTQARSSIETRWVLGVALQGGTFGDNSSRSGWSAGVLLGVQTRWKPERNAGVMLDIGLQPQPSVTPFLERLRVISFQVAREMGKELRFRPGVGLALHYWSGNQVEPQLKLAPAVGVAVGVRALGSGHWRLRPELMWRSSIEYGAVASTLGIQVAFSRHTLR